MWGCERALLPGSSFVAFRDSEAVLVHGCKDVTGGGSGVWVVSCLCSIESRFNISVVQGVQCSLTAAVGCGCSSRLTVAGQDSENRTFIVCSS